LSDNCNICSDVPCTKPVCVRKEYKIYACADCPAILLCGFIEKKNYSQHICDDFRKKVETLVNNRRSEN
jgi:hypothetical protein